MTEYLHTEVGLKQNIERINTIWNQNLEGETPRYLPQPLDLQTSRHSIA